MQGAWTIGPAAGIAPRPRRWSWALARRRAFVRFSSEPVPVCMPGLCGDHEVLGVQSICQRYCLLRPGPPHGTQQTSGLAEVSDVDCAVGQSGDLLFRSCLPQGIRDRDAGPAHLRIALPPSGRLSPPVVRLPLTSSVRFLTPAPAGNADEGQPGRGTVNTRPNYPSEAIGQSLTLVGATEPGNGQADVVSADTRVTGGSHGSARI